MLQKDNSSTGQSQFPFWDFFCCNERVYVEAVRLNSISGGLNSLFGISFVVTQTKGLVGRGRPQPQCLNSLFGISFVVTGVVVNGVEGRIFSEVSIPFLGFLLL